jgi:hypothetical protein
MMWFALKHVGVLTLYKILLIYVCCAFVGLDNKLYKMHGTYIKIVCFGVHSAWIMKSINSSLCQ